jgi:Methyltransferase FkbM domain
LALMPRAEATYSVSAYTVRDTPGTAPWLAGDTKPEPFEEMMQIARRMFYEYTNLASVLSPKLVGKVLFNSVRHAPSILRTGKLIPLDRAMSQEIVVTFHGRRFSIPANAIDAHLLSGINDSFTFGTVREMYANDVYLRAFKPSLRCPCVLDLGCNRGMFSLIARKVLDARVVIGVEPEAKYQKVHQLLSSSNQMPDLPARPYWKMVGSTVTERTDSAFVSIDTLIRENNLTAIDFAKIDIEGAESEIFAEPGWLGITRNIAMELHPEFSDMTPVLKAVGQSGFEMRTTDQFGKLCDAARATFLYASRTGSLRG